MFSTITIFQVNHINYRHLVREMQAININRQPYLKVCTPFFTVNQTNKAGYLVVVLASVLVFFELTESACSSDNKGVECSFGYSECVTKHAISLIV